jgi:hypothetical protein
MSIINGINFIILLYHKISRATYILCPNLPEGICSCGRGLRNFSCGRERGRTSKQRSGIVRGWHLPLPQHTPTQPTERRKTCGDLHPDFDAHLDEQEKLRVEGGGDKGR